MAQSIVIQPKAQQDLASVADYLKLENPAVAARFLAAAEETFQFLEANREIGSLCTFAKARLARMRMWRIRGFKNYVVFYVDSAARLEIIRVLHGARDSEAIVSESSS